MPLRQLSLVVRMMSQDLFTRSCKLSPSNSEFEDVLEAAHSLSNSNTFCAH